MNLATLQDLYLAELHDLHSAETQMRAVFPKIVKAAKSADLKDALKAHHDATRSHLKRLSELLERHGSGARADICQAMDGLLRQAERMLDVEGDENLRDLRIISSCQRIEHYEMVGYGNARSLAEQLGHYDDFALLTETLEEESAAEDELASVAILLLSEYETTRRQSDSLGAPKGARGICLI